MNFTMEALVGIYDTLSDPEKREVSRYVNTLLPTDSEHTLEVVRKALFGSLIVRGHIAEFREPLMVQMAEEYDLAMQGADLLDCQPMHVEPNKSHTRRYGP